MAKFQIKYLTNPNKEVVNFISNFNNQVSVDMLKDKYNFILILYSFNKMNGVYFLNNNDKERHLVLSTYYSLEEKNIAEIIGFLKNKFKNYIFYTPILKNRSQTICNLKKFALISNDNCIKIRF